MKQNKELIMEDIIINLNEYTTEQLREVFGEYDSNIKYLSTRLGISVARDADGLKFVGDDDKVKMLEQIIDILLSKAQSGENINKTTLRLVTDIVPDGQSENIDSLTDAVAFTHRGKPIKAKSVNQAKYLQAIKNNSLTFGIGPAGTGKTYLAVAMAVASYKAKMVEKIVLTRPAVEAGEKLGFLPGDLGQKVDPYLKPLFDALIEMMGLEVYTRLMEKGVIEVAPLAYMRGRTISNAFIILDEAQNTTKEQMKMFLTRIGEGSRVVVTGDVTQIDLPYGKKSGLVEASQILEGIEDISINYFKDKDVVRHELVMKIVKAYDNYYKLGENDGKNEGGLSD